MSHFQSIIVPITIKILDTNQIDIGAKKIENTKKNIKKNSKPFYLTTNSKSHHKDIAE